MAGYNRNSYQYETSPRKLEPEYRPIKKKYPKLYSCRDYSNIEHIMETPDRNLELFFDPTFCGVFTDLND